MIAATTNPLESTKARLLCAAIVFTAAILLYAITLAPTVTLVDSGELIVAARGLGVAHPPGFPLYVLLAHIATLAPFGNVAARVNFASALFAAMAAAALALVVAEAFLTASAISIAKNRDEKKIARGKKAKKRTDATESDIEESASATLKWIVAFTPCLSAGLLFAFSRTLWAYATIAEVYTLNSLLILLIFLLMFRWRRSHETQGRGDADRRKHHSDALKAVGMKEVNKPSLRNRVGVSPHHQHLYIAAFIFGLALGVHHVTVGLMIVALAYLVYSTEGIGFFTSKRLLYAALFAFVGLGIYIYLPIAASRAPAMNWGNPQTLERFWWHVSGRQYQVNFSFDLSRFGEFARLALREFGPWWIPLGLALSLTGFVAAFKRDRTLFWFFALAIISDLIYGMSYEIAEDKDAYYLPAFITMAIATGIGARWLISSIRFNRATANISGYATGAIVALVVPILALASNLPYNNRSRYYIAKDYVENIFRTVEPNALLLTADWQVYSPMLYLQQVEGERTDVISIDIKQLRRSWYFDFLSRAYPQLIERTRDKVDAFLEDLRSWEHNPDLYQRDLALNQRINSRFYDMILAFISTQIQSGPVYLTRDVATGLIGNAIDPEDAELRKAVSETYQLVPQGLVFQLFLDRDFHNPSEPQLTTRGLTDGTIKFEEDDPVKVKVLPVYANMLYNRGYYLAQANQHERAIEAFKQALVFAPDYTLAKQSLNESLRKLSGGPTPKQ